MTHPFYASRRIYWGFGFHCTATGDHKGVGDYIRACRDRGVPVSIYSTDSAGVVLEALKSGSHPDDCIGFRRTAIPGIGDVDRLPVDSSTGLYTGDPIAQFDRLYDIHEQYFPAELRPYRDRIWYTCVNEPNTYSGNNAYNEHDAQYLATGFLHIANRAIADGIRYACAGWAGGNPHHDFWRHPLTLEYLRLAEQHPTQIGVNWHLYSLDNGNLLANFGDQVGRYKYLYDVCKSEGIAPPYIIAGEFGWGESAISISAGEAIAQMVAVQDQMVLDNIWWGGCMWTLGKWSGSIVNDMIRLLPYNIDMINNYQPVTIPAIDGGDDMTPKECDLYLDLGRFVHLLPQDTTSDEIASIAVKFNASRNSFVYSHDDAELIVAHGMGQNSEGKKVSEVKIWEPQRFSFDVAGYFANKGYAFSVGYFVPPPTSFTFSHYPCVGVTKQINQAFGANPQNYAQFGLPGHDGIDFYAPHGTPIVAVAGGQVYRVETVDNSNYGKQVRIDHGDGHKTVYAHLNNVDVTVGQFVTDGQKLGNADNTGNSFGSHLHLTYKREGLTYTDAKGNVWPYNIFDPTSLIAPLMPTTPPPPSGELVNVGSYMIAHPDAWRVVYNIDPNGARSGQDIQDMDLGNGLMVRSKSTAGTSAEWWRFDANHAYLVADTSHGFDTMYTIAKGGTVGNSPKNPLQMRVNEQWTEQGTHYVQVKKKQGCANIDGSGTGYATNTARLLWRNQAYKFPAMPVTLDVIAILTTNGETQLYAKTNQQSAVHYSVPVGLSLGWVGWVASWGRAELEELWFSRGQLTKEPNRFCGW